jgi:hypothetical protein
MAYGIRSVSHYQGSSPGPVLMAFETREEADRIENEVSTCSFCHPGRVRNYSTGSCYEVVKTSREAGYQHEDCPDCIVEAATGLAR